MADATALGVVAARLKGSSPFLSRGPTKVGPLYLTGRRAGQHVAL